MDAAQGGNNVFELPPLKSAQVNSIANKKRYSLTGTFENLFECVLIKSDDF